MRLLLIVLLITTNIFAVEIRGYKAYSPDWEINYSPPPDKPFFKLYAHGGLKGMSCGAESLAFYNFAMDLNLEALQDLLENWKDIAFPLALYTLGTYFPVVKEALVGAEYLADNVAQLKNFNCESAMNMIKTYNKKGSKIVRACVLKRIGRHLNIWTATQEEIENAVKDVSESEIRSAYDYCMNNATIFDALPIPDINKYLKKYNPRKLIMCKYASKLGLDDLGDKYNADRTLLSGGTDIKTLAQVFALAVTPEFIIDNHTKRLMLKPIEVDGKILDSSTLSDILKTTVDEDFNNILSFLDRPLNVYLDRVKTMNNKYQINNSDNLLAEFGLIWTVNRKLLDIWDGHNGDYETYARGKELLNKYIRDLKKQYLLLKEYNVRKMAREMQLKAKHMSKSKELFGNLECD